jgi:hypothetical protein
LVSDHTLLALYRFSSCLASDITGVVSLLILSSF